MITLTNGREQNPSGIAIPNGSIRFQLNLDATIVADPCGLVPAAVTTTFYFDSTGNLQQPAQLYSNAELNPQNQYGLGTLYLVTLYDQNGARLNEAPMWWQFPNASGETVDISQMTAVSSIGGNVLYYPTLKNLSSISNFFTGSGNPTTVPGQQDNNLYLNISNGALWQLQAGTWVQIANTGNAPVTPGGSTGDIQFNNSGAFGGSPNLALAGTVTEYAGQTLTANGIPSITNEADAAFEQGNISGFPLSGSLPSSGFYRVSGAFSITTPGTVSSTLPSSTITYTHAVTGATITVDLSATSTSNTTATCQTGAIVIYAAQGTAVTYSTASYASSGSTAMQYRADLRLEWLG